MWEKVHGINISKQQFVTKEKHFNINVHLFKLLTGPLTLFLNQFFPKASIWNSPIGIHIIKFSLAVQKLCHFKEKKHSKESLFYTTYFAPCCLCLKLVGIFFVWYFFPSLFHRVTLIYKCTTLFILLTGIQCSFILTIHVNPLHWIDAISMWVQFEKFILWWLRINSVI